MINVRSSLPSALVTLGTYLNALSQWYLIWLFARTSGAEAAGLYASIFAYATPVFVVAHFGLRDHYLTSRHKYPWSVYLWMRLFGIISGIAIMLLVTWLVELPLAMTAAVTAMKVANAALDLFNGKIQRSLDFLALGLISVTNALITILAATVAAASLGGIVGVVGAVWASALVSLLCCFGAWYTGRHINDEGEQNAGDLSGILNDTLPITVSHLAASLSASIPVIVVERTGSSADVGVFSAAAYLLTVANLTGAAVRITTLPRLAILYREQGESMLHRQAKRLAIYWLLAGLIALIPAVVFGPAVLAAIYGPEFIMDRLPIALLALAAVITIPSFIISAQLLVMNAYRSQSQIGIISVISAVVVALVASSWADLSALVIGALTAFCGKLVQTVLTILRARPRYSELFLK